MERHFDTESGLSYLELKDGTFVGEHTSLDTCPKCGRNMEATNIDMFGEILDECREFEDAFELLCTDCMSSAYHEGRDRRNLEILEEIGLSAHNREALAKIAQLVKDNPTLAFQIVEVHSRIDELGRRLDDRTDSIEREVSSKLHSSTIWLNVAISVGSFLAGIVVTLLGFLLVS